MGFNPLNLTPIGLLKKGVDWVKKEPGKTREELALEAKKRALEGISLPGDEELINLADAQYQIQDVGPAILESDRAIAKSALESGFSIDPKQRAAQMRALSQLEQIGQEGLGVEDEVAASKLRRQLAVAARGAKGAVEQNMAARGMESSGMSSVLQQQAQQQAAEAAQGQQEAQLLQAQQARREAIAGAGDLASKYRGQEVQEQSAAAQAKDVMTRFSDDLAAQRAARNVAARRDIESEKLSERRLAENSRAGAREAEERRRADLVGIRYGRELGRTGALTDLDRMSAAARDAAIARKKGAIWGAAKGVARIGGALLTGGVSELANQGMQMVGGSALSQNTMDKLQSTPTFQAREAELNADLGQRQAEMSQEDTMIATQKRDAAERAQRAREEAARKKAFSGF
jgi:hypothetical protein